jgi:hypothetical protein
MSKYRHFIHKRKLVTEVNCNNYNEKFELRIIMLTFEHMDIPSEEYVELHLRILTNFFFFRGLFGFYSNSVHSVK